ncbi:DUF2273 domain-containing protein [Enorma burkinafasonensis]|uniref:DUF2273 domain-containing protein n=1 Tax=Enorma burkinafasonensis TaxID=2590867 RepID=UPI0026EA4FCB|nr:DUF2273 domain-containing protein [Enorma burkinafasonensis]MCI7730956.1 DUF2273 domain-containing protein [Enorma burkinafasonensis]
MSRRSKGTSSPKFSIDQEEPTRIDEVQDEVADEDAAKKHVQFLTAEDLEGAVGFVRGLGAAAWHYAGKHPYTVSYGFIGLVLAVLILTIGLWSTIVIAVFVVVGAMVGQIRDGENGIVNFFRRLFSNGR